MTRRRICDQVLPVRAVRLADNHWATLDRLDRDGAGRSAVLRRLLDAIDSSVTIDGSGAIIANGGRITVDQRAAAAE